MQENIHTKALLECIEPDSVIWFWNERKPENMPYAFRKMGDKLFEWFNDQDQREEIVKLFENELYAGSVTVNYLNRLRKSWKLESYYQDLINWYNEEQIKNCKFYIGETVPNEPSRMGRISKKYPFLEKRVVEGIILSEDEQTAWEEYLFMANEIEKGRIALTTIKSYCNAALWFIKSSKNIVEKWESEKPVTAPVAQKVDNKGSYNAKVKAKFFELVIDKYDSKVLNDSYKNNDEKFNKYTKVMSEHLGLTIAAGTLENNWGKELNEIEKRQVIKLLKEYKQQGLAVKFSLEP